MPARLDARSRRWGAGLMTRKMVSRRSEYQAEHNTKRRRRRRARRVSAVSRFAASVGMFFLAMTWTAIWTAGPTGAQTQSPVAGPAGAPLISRDPDKLVFPRNYWDPTQHAFLLVVEFLQSDWDKRLKLDPPPSDRAQIEEEIRHLHSLISQRDERRDEIKAQDEALEPYFHPILMMQPATHRRTAELLYFTHYMGMVGMVYKHRFNRARPSQLSPSLLPMLTVAGHPAYPSGHGFQSWLGALVLSELRPDARGALMAMAQRIGFNREIAGVHYPSDTKAGQNLAAQAFEIVKQGKHFQELAAEAKAELR
jgi:hypothetical protein